MADYIYLLQNRLSAAQQAALQSIRDVARSQGLTVFLVGGAVRDLTSGSPVRDLDVVVQGNALKLKKDLELTGAVLVGELAPAQTVFMRFPGGVRMEIGSTLSVTYPKPGKPVVQAATILDDLRRRDFTVNAMALSLNEGSYGLLMDPLNGVADIENRQLRLVSNYGFIEDPVRMIRATRFSARLGWTMDEKTQARYETGKDEKYIGALSGVLRGYETEEIFHEEDPLRVLRKLEEEGWMKHLFPAMTVAKANVAELAKLREVETQLQVSGIHPDAAAAHFPLLTAKLTPAELAELKKSFVRQGFVTEVEALEAEAKDFAAQLAGKGAALPSQAWKLLHAAKPEAVLWAAYTSKSPAVQAKFKSFHTEWPKARQKVPFALMAEMRIVPELDSFNDVVEQVFFELMDGNLATSEEQKVFLEPFSPPAPPPPVRMARSRAGKKDSKGAKGKKKLAADEDDADLDRDDEESPRTPDDESEAVELSDAGMDEEEDEVAELRMPRAPRDAPEFEEARPGDSLGADEDDDEEDEVPTSPANAKSIDPTPVVKPSHKGKKPESKLAEDVPPAIEIETGAVRAEDSTAAPVVVAKPPAKTAARKTSPAKAAKDSLAQAPAEAPSPEQTAEKEPGELAQETKSDKVGAKHTTVKAVSAKAVAAAKKSR